ncbi:MAG: transporter [Halioglobus sp.]
MPDPSLPIAGVDSSITQVLAGYLHTLDLFGRTANFIVNVPFANGETNATIKDIDYSRDYEGMGDITATLSLNLMGAPAMDAAAFGKLRENPKPILGASVKLVAPTGQYNSNRAINVGANRWASKVELGYILPISPRWLLETDAGAWFFADNDNFLGTTREQEAIYSLQFHLIHRFSPGFWASLDLNGYKGGRSTVGNIELDDVQRDSRWGVTFVLPITRGHAIRTSYSSGSANDSNEDFDIFTVSYQMLL